MQRVPSLDVVLSLTEEQLALRDAGDSAAFLRSVFLHLNELSGDHWWCTAPAIAAELLPYMSGDGASADSLRSKVAQQLAGCSSCAKGFYDAPYAWQATTAMCESDVSCVLRDVREWSAQRLIRLLDEAVEERQVAFRQVANAAGNVRALDSARLKCEALFFEMLMDARLVMREDVARSIGAMFAKFNTVKDGSVEAARTVDENGVCSPGIFVLCFHVSVPVREWALRCISKYLFAGDEEGVTNLEVSLPPSVVDLLAYCTERVEGGVDSSILDLTCDDDPLGVEMMFPCTLEVIWIGLSRIFKCFKSPELFSAVLERHAGFFAHLVSNLECDYRHYVVKSSAHILSHLLKLFGYRVWLGGVDVEPNTLFVSAKEAFDNPLASEDVKACLFELFPPFVRSLTGLKRAETVMIVGCCLDLLLEASQVSPDPKKGRGILLYYEKKNKATSSPGKARLSAASVLLGCYQQLPQVVSTVDSKKVAELLRLMLTGDGVQLVPKKLLRTILIHDASNIVRAVTGPAVSEMAIAARPACVSVEALSVAESGDSDVEEVVEEVIYSTATKSSTADYSPFARGGEFSWSKHVWENVLAKKYRVHSLISSKRIDYPECDALLDVHALLGMLDLLACDLPLEEVQKRLTVIRDTVYLSDDVRGRVKDLERASLDLAFVTCIQAVSEQVGRAHTQMIRKDSKSFEPWTKKLPECAGHLLASSKKDIRERTFGLLQFVSSTGGRVAGFNHGSEEALSDMRKILANEARGASVMRGTGEAMALLSVYGPQYSFRCYMHMMIWIERLLNADMDVTKDFIENEGQDQVTALVEQFVLTWRDQLEAKPRHFGEITSRFLSVWSNLWRFILPSDGDESRREKHFELLDLALLFASCESCVVQAKWSSLVANVAERHSFDERHKLQIAALLANCAQKPASFRFADCNKLSNAFNLTGVTFPKPEGGNPSNLKPTNLPVPKPGSNHPTGWSAYDKFDSNEGLPFCPSPPRAQGRVNEGDRLDMLRARETTAVIRRRQGSKSRLRSKLGPISRGNTKPRGAEAPGRKELKKGPAEGGKTKMQLRQEAAAAAADKRRQEVKEKDRGTKMTVLTEAPARSATLPVAISAARQDVVASSALVERTRRQGIVEARRRLKKRDLDMFHGKLVRHKVSSILNDEELHSSKLPRPPDDFQSSEEYVLYWEGLVFEELLSQIRQALDAEANVAGTNPPDNENGWACRTPFEVAVPATPDKSGCFKKIVLRYSGSVFLRNSNPLIANKGTGGWVEDYSAAKLWAGDLLRVQMVKHGRGHALGDHSSPEFVLLLGVVDSVTFQGRDVLVTVKVRFPTSFTEPGPERAVCLSKLFSMTTSHRQLQALWRVNKLPPTVLHALIHPKSFWKEKRRSMNKESSRALSGHSSISMARGDVIRELKSSGLNTSQISFIEESAKLISAPSSRPGGQGFNLLQGPPGTGKTNTSLALMSVILADTLGVKAPKPMQRRTLHVKGMTVKVPFAPQRILVCAPSNAAVDELLVRVLRNGLLTPSGSRATPRVVRVGSGSKDDEVLSVTLNSILDSQEGGSASGRGDFKRDARNGEEQDAQLERKALRGRIQEASAAVGVAHNARKDAQKAFVTTMSEETSLPDKERKEKEAQFEKQHQALSQNLYRAHEKKKEISKLLKLADQKAKQADQRADLDSITRKASVINSASIIFSTLNAAAHDVLGLSCAPFDAVVIDEAAQSVEPDILIPLIGVCGKSPRASDCVSKCFMVGDPKQLPATVLSNNADVVTGLGRSLFERLQDAKYSRVHLLSTQYRMHPVIASFPSSHFYNSRLCSGPSVKSSGVWKPYHFDRDARFGPLTFLDTSGASGVCESKSGGGSIQNDGEAQIVCSLLITLFKQYPSELLEQGQVAVLTPYKRQVGLIRQHINRVGSLSRAEIEVSTVDGIQGREKAIVIVSTVRGGRSGNGIGFVKDTRRMNVALTRAKLSLIVVGDSKRLSAHSSDWSAFVRHCESINRVRQVTAARQRFPEAFLRKGQQLPAPSQVPRVEDLPVFDLDVPHRDGEREEVLEISDSEDDVVLEPVASLAHVRKHVEKRESAADPDGRTAGRKRPNSAVTRVHENPQQANRSRPKPAESTAFPVPRGVRTEKRLNSLDVSVGHRVNDTAFPPRGAGVKNLPPASGRGTTHDKKLRTEERIDYVDLSEDTPPPRRVQQLARSQSEFDGPPRPSRVIPVASFGRAAERPSAPPSGLRGITPAPVSKNRSSEAATPTTLGKRPEPPSGNRASQGQEKRFRPDPQATRQAQRRVDSHNLGKARNSNSGRSALPSRQDRERLQNMRSRQTAGGSAVRPGPRVSDNRSQAHIPRTSSGSSAAYRSAPAGAPERSGVKRPATANQPALRFAQARPGEPVPPGRPSHARKKPILPPPGKGPNATTKPSGGGFNLKRLGESVVKTAGLRNQAISGDAERDKKKKDGKRYAQMRPGEAVPLRNSSPAPKSRSLPPTEKGSSATAKSSGGGFSLMNAAKSAAKTAEARNQAISGDFERDKKKKNGKR